MTRPPTPEPRLIALAVLAAILIVFVPKGVSAAAKASVAMLLLLAAAIHWAWQGVQTAADSPPRRFWRLVATALAAWLLFDLSLALPASASHAAAALGVACLSASFVLFLLALDQRPHLAERRDQRRSRAVEQIGAVVFTFGLLVYGTGLGRSAENRSFDLGQGSLALGFALYLFARLVILVRASGSTRWRSAYSALVVGVGTLALSEGAGLKWRTPSGAVWVVLRLCGPLACGLAAFWSARGLGAFEGLDLDETETVASTRPEPLARFWSGSVSLYAASFPVIHLGGYSLGLLDPELKTVRDGWTLIFLLVLSGVAASMSGASSARWRTSPIVFSGTPTTTCSRASPTVSGSWSESAARSTVSRTRPTTSSPC